MAKAGSAASGTPSSTQDSRTDEWTAARSNIERFDGYLNDLRKYGFGLVTSLLAVTGYLSSSPDTKLPDATKLVVSVAILALVVALSFLDGQYRSLQRGATVRARILERSLNLDLTSAISHYVQIGRYTKTYLVVYGVVASATAIVALGVLWGDWTMVLLLVIAFLVALFLIWKLGGDSLKGVVDWSVDAKIVSQGDPVHVTFTNLQELRGGAWLFAGCKIRGLDSNYDKRLPVRRASTHFMSQADWLWPTDSSIKKGLYQVIGYWHLVNEQGKPVDAKTVPGGIVSQMPLEFPTWSPTGPSHSEQVSRYATVGTREALGTEVILAPAEPDTKGWPSWALTIQVVEPPSNHPK
jgi:hypothetical protein